MARKRLRQAASFPTHPPSSESQEAIDLLCSVGASGVMSLLAWLWVTYPDQSGLLAERRFARLGPSAHLCSHIPAYLEKLGLLVRTPTAERGLRIQAREEEWTFARHFTSPSSAELAILVACRRLNRTSTFFSEARRLWLDLAVSEVIGFLEAELQDHQFDAAWSALVEPAVERALERFSIAQSFYFSWLAVRDLASAYLKHPHSRDRLHDTLRRSFESRIGRAQSERWNAPPFFRHARNPESALAYVFASVLTNLGPNFLTARISEDALQKCVINV